MMKKYVIIVNFDDKEPELFYFKNWLEVKSYAKSLDGYGVTYTLYSKPIYIRNGDLWAQAFEDLREATSNE